MTRAGVVAIAIASASAARADSLGVSSYRLANGLQVILAPDASLGAVAVHVWYRVGAQDDPPGRQGLTRLVAQLADRSSAHVKPGARVQAIDDAGGWSVVQTELDHTSFVAQVPANALALALYFEADRLAGLRDVATASAIDEERRKIVLELRTARSMLSRALSSDDHLPTDVRRGLDHVTASDVEAWWRARLAPENATLVITGNFDRAAATALAERYFAWIPARPRAVRDASIQDPPKQTIELTAREPAASPQLVIAFRTDRARTAATSDLDVAARILANGKTSRLYRRLVVTDRLATDVFATLTRGSQIGQLAFEIAVRDPGAFAAARAAVLDELARLRDHPVTASELARAKAGLVLDLMTSIETPAFRAEMLAAWSAYDDSLDESRARIEAVTDESLRRAAKRWLVEQAAVVMTVLPAQGGP